MPPPADRASPSSLALVAALAAAGFALTLYVFYPGVMTYDARYVYEDIAKGALGDWQSPMMTVLWALIDPVAPGPASMLLLMSLLYWLAYALIAAKLAHSSRAAAIVLLLLAMTPPAFAFTGIIWRDVLFADTWLIASALAFATTGSGKTMKILAQAAALALLALGVLLRPNALIAAPILGAAIVWPAQFSWKRTAIALIPGAIACFALVQIVYYGALGATRQHPLQSVMVFDLGGISHFAGQNQYPATWTDAQNRMLVGSCYQPTQWDIYWRIAPCDFVMHKLEHEDKLFGTPAIAAAWARAIAYHPLAYLEHRAAFMWNFLAGDNLAMWTIDVYDPSKPALAGHPAFAALVRIQDALKPTPLFRAGTWLIACFAVCAVAWRQRDSAKGAFAIGLCGSAAIYVLTFFPVGVASDFRYGYWAVLAAFAGVAAIAMPRRV